jgi:phosphohistidine phosphatase
MVPPEASAHTTGHAVDAVKTLILLRHAKSSWGDRDLDDRDRPLAKRGKRAAGLIGRYVQDNEIRPALVLCSPARRAQDTLAIVRPALGTDVDVHTDEAIYTFDADDLLERLRSVPSSVVSVMVVGHNPALHDVAALLAGDGDAEALADLRAKFPTGALAILDLGDVSWSRLHAGQAYLAGLVLPRRLES